jgi:integrase
MKLGDLRRADIQQYITERAGKVSPGSVTKEVNCLKHLLGLAVEWELIPFNPALKIKAPKVPAGRVRYLQPTELRALLAACPAWLRPITALAAFTAMRRGEILNLRWLNVDLQGLRLILTQTKNGDGRVVYLIRWPLMSLKASGPKALKLQTVYFLWLKTVHQTTSRKVSQRSVGALRSRTSTSTICATLPRYGCE